MDRSINISRPPKLLDQMREALRSRHYSRRTEQTYCQWVKRYIFFHKVRHPAEMAEPEINAFLTHLARLCLRPLIHHLFLPSLVLGPGILLRDDVRVVITSHVIPAGNAGT